MKSVVRGVARGVALLVAAPFYVLHRVEALVLGRERSFMGMSQLLALVPGIYGVWLRVAFYRLALCDCAPSCAIEFMTTFVTPDVKLGRNVYIGSHCNIGLADIGDDCLIGSHVLVTSGRNVHRFDDVETPIRLQGGERETTHIGRDCWIGNGAVVMADVGEGCVVAAGGVVVSPLPPYSVAAGVPARVMRRRGDTRHEGAKP